jgi:hypothetical protein
MPHFFNFKNEQTKLIELLDVPLTMHVDGANDTVLNGTKPVENSAAFWHFQIWTDQFNLLSWCAINNVYRANANGVNVDGKNDKALNVPKTCRK